MVHAAWYSVGASAHQAQAFRLTTTAATNDAAVVEYKTGASTLVYGSTFGMAGDGTVYSVGQSERLDGMSFMPLHTMMMRV